MAEHAGQIARADGALAVQSGIQTLVSNNHEVKVSIAEDEPLYAATKSFLSYVPDPGQPGRYVTWSLSLAAHVLPVARLPVVGEGLDKFHPLVIRGVDAAPFNRVNEILKNKGVFNEDITSAPSLENALENLDVSDVRESLVIQPSEVYEGDPFDDPGEPARQPRGRAQQAPPPGREPTPGPAGVKYLAEVDPAELQDREASLPLKSWCRLLKLLGPQAHTHASRQDRSGVVQKAARVIKIFASQYAYPAAGGLLDDAAIAAAVGPFLRQVELPNELRDSRSSPEDSISELSDAYKFVAGSPQDVDGVINRRLINVTR